MCIQERTSFSDFVWVFSATTTAGKPLGSAGSDRGDDEEAI